MPCLMVAPIVAELAKDYTGKIVFCKLNMDENRSIAMKYGIQSIFKEKCLQCGECELGRYAGICPMTQCAKGLLNGPCGGSQNGKCEVDPERDCAWVLIYERLKEFGELDRFRKEEPRIKDYSKIGRPREIEVSPLVLE